MNQKQIINIFRSTGALLSGHFVLTSGRHSDTYFQCARVLQFPEYLSAFSLMIADEFRENDPDVVISPAIGGIVLGTEVGTQLGCRTIFAERKEGKMVLRRGFSLEKGEKVLIVEDVVTTGGSVKEVMELVSPSEVNIIGLGVFVDRSNGSVILHKNHYSIVKLDIASYSEKSIPASLSSIPIQKPGSRNS